MPLSSPRVLLLSDEGPNQTSAGGILLSRLFATLPSEALFVIERRIPAQEDARKRMSLRPPWMRFEQSRFHRWKRSLRGFGLVPGVPADRIDRMLNGFRPEVVVTVMQHAAFYGTAYSYARAHGLPLVAIVHDVNDRFEPVLDIAREAVRRRDAAFYRYATSRLCVSPEMAAFCAERYGAPGEVMYPNRSEDLRSRPVAEARTLKTPGQLTIGFVGNLNYGYGEELLRLLPALRASASRLVILSHPPGPSAAPLLEARDCVDYRGFLPSQEAWRQTQADCDAVLLAYPNPAGAMEALYRSHFPSKLPEYLALGMPVIVTGPDYATGVKWAMRHPEAAASYSAPDIAGVARLLEGLRSSANMRESLAKGALKTGDREFDPVRIREQFLRVLDAARKPAVD